MVKPVFIGFNYDLLETRLADKIRSAADRIRERIKKTLEDIIEVGNDLLAVKESLPHGQFLPWLRAEFGWSERSAQNFMNVAEQFKSARIADLPIQPSAAYLLAAPSVPDEAREKAVEKAEAGAPRLGRGGRGLTQARRARPRGRNCPNLAPWFCSAAAAPGADAWPRRPGSMFGARKKR